MRALPFLVASVLIAACGDGRARTPGTGTATSNNNTRSDAGVITGEHAARCMLACTEASQGPCASGPSGECNSDCAVLTEGFSAECVACVLAESAWAGQACTCYGTGCTLCGFGPGDHACSGAAPEETCSSTDEVCDGFEFAKVTLDGCGALCFPDNNPPDLGPTLAARCDRLCADRPRACAQASAETCVSTCMTQVAGLPSGCALCLLESSAWSGRACTCDGVGCTLCGFSAEPEACRSAGPEETCGPADEVCDGMDFASPGGACSDYCQ